MVIKTLNHADYETYDHLLKESKLGTIFQSIPYLSALSMMGYDFELLGYYENTKLLYVLPVQKKSFPIVNRFYYAIPYGVVTKEVSIPISVLDAFLVYLKKKGWIIQLSLNELVNLNGFSFKTENTTLMIDLKEPLNNIFEGFSKTHRSCVRKAIKEGVVVEFSKDINYIDQFMVLYEAMMDEKSYVGIETKVIIKMMNTILKNNLGFFAVARYNDNIQNIAFVSILGDKARYLYGASLRNQKNIPPIGQYLHYEIMEYLIKENFATYDLGGIPNLPVDINHPAYYVYKFKKGFGGNPVILSYDYVYKKYKFLKWLKR